MASKAPPSSSRRLLAAALVALALALVAALATCPPTNPPNADADADADAGAAADAGADAVADAGAAADAVAGAVADAAAASIDKKPAWAPSRARWVRTLTEGKSITLNDVAPSESAIYFTGRAGQNELRVLALAADGSVLWDKRFGEGLGRSISAYQKRILVAGEQKVPGPDGERVSRASFLMLDETGAVSWTKTLGPPGTFAAFAAIGGAGQALLATELLAKEGAPATELVALDAAGQVRWDKPIGGGAGGLRVSRLLVDASGGLFVGGGVSGKLDIGGAHFATSELDTIGVVARLAEDGAVDWVKELGRVTNGLSLVHLASDGAGGVIALARSDAGEPSAFEMPGEARVTHFDAAGKVLFERRFGPDVAGEGIARTTDGDIVVSGRFAGAVDFGSGFLRGNGDGFLLVLDAEGKIRFSDVVGPLSGAIAVGADGSILVASDGHGKEAPMAASLSAEPPREKPSEVPAPKKPTHAIYQFFALDGARDGATGKIVLLQDSRIEKSDHEEACFHWTPLEGLGERFDSPPLGAAVGLLDEKGALVSKIPLLHPIARLDPWKLYEGERQTFALTENDSICIGSFRGNIVTLVEVVGGKPVKLSSVDVDGKNPQRIEMWLGLRGDMRLVPARSGKGKDILYARSGLSTTALQRYSFEGGRWVRRVRELSTTWMFGEGGPGSFPERKDFP